MKKKRRKSKDDRNLDRACKRRGVLGSNQSTVDMKRRYAAMRKIRQNMGGCDGKPLFTLGLDEI